MATRANGASRIQRHGIGFSTTPTGEPDGGTHGPMTRGGEPEPIARRVARIFRESPNANILAARSDSQRLRSQGRYDLHIYRFPRCLTEFMRRKSISMRRIQRIFPAIHGATVIHAHFARQNNAPPDCRRGQYYPIRSLDYFRTCASAASPGFGRLYSCIGRQGETWFCYGPETVASELRRHYQRLFCR